MLKFLTSLFVLVFVATAAHADVLQVKGNKLFFGEREVMLQGIAVGDPLLGRKGRPLTDYDTISHDWNANVVRISVHPGTWRDQGRIKVLEALHPDVSEALNAGMFVIITWHAIGAPDGWHQESPDEYGNDLYDTDFRLARDFWKSVAREFGYDGRIMFELWNEPAYEPDGSGSHLQPKWEQLRPYWQQLRDIVRQYTENVIIVSSAAWGYNLRGAGNLPLDDDNAMYAWHVYGGTDNNNPGAWNVNLDGLADRKPVIVTEWGFEPDLRESPYYGNAQNYGYLFYDDFIRRKGLHFTAWCYHPKWTPRMLKGDWKTPTAYGWFVKEIMWRRSKDELVRP